MTLSQHLPRRLHPATQTFRATARALAHRLAHWLARALRPARRVRRPLSAPPALGAGADAADRLHSLSLGADLGR